MERKINKKYENATLENALHAIRNGMSFKKAATQFKIPKTTLIDKINKKYKSDSVGVRTVLTPEEEENIAMWIIYLGKAGFPVTKTQLIESVTELIKKLSRSNPFKNGVPGRHWYEGFLSRHPELSKRISQNLTKPRAEVTEYAIRDWFRRVESFFTEQSFLDILQDPKRMFNCDETGFYLAPKEKQVIVRKGSRKVYNRIANDEKECLTVLLTVRADGEILCPLVLFPYKRMPPSICTKMPSKWGIGRSDSGWMTSQSFYEFITNVFFKWLQDNEVVMPVVLFLDGHSSHLSLPLVEFCKKEGIILTALLPNSTHILQPLDVAVFKPLKQSRKDCIHNWRLQHPGEKLKREDFSPVLKNCLGNFCSGLVIKKGFETCGLYPSNVNNVDFGKVLPKPKDQIIIEPFQAKQLSCTCENDLQFLRQFEERIDKNILHEFKSSSAESWSGAKHLEGLYNFWKEIRKCPKLHTDKPIDQEHTTTDNLDKEQECNNEDVEKSLNCSLHEVTLDNNLPNIDVSFTSNTSHINIDDTVWLENNNILNLDIQSDGRVDIVNSGEQNKDFTEVDNVLKEINVELAITSDENQEDIVSVSEENVNKEPYFANNKTPIKKNLKENLPTPFKTALFWPESVPDPKKDKGKRTITKKTPTVAISDEFIEYQRRIEEEKKKKTEEKLQRVNKRKASMVKNNVKIRKLPNDETLNTSSTSSEVQNYSGVSEMEGKIDKAAPSSIYSVGDFIIFSYESKYFPGSVIEHAGEGYMIKTMAACGSYWKWPDKEDILIYPNSDIICKIPDPELMNSRGQYNVPMIQRLKTDKITCSM